MVNTPNVQIHDVHQYVNTYVYVCNITHIHTKDTYIHTYIQTYKHDKIKDKMKPHGTVEHSSKQQFYKSKVIIFTV